jgi:hypothetical protein
MPERVTRLRQLAGDALADAALTSDTEARDRYLRLAKRWNALADDVEKMIARDKTPNGP